ncbi:hypothetical protein NC99_24650 [Sunxiuqinia dokdonensis]|uniref:Uncharacterized protein n=1 Tax=Sunxiuqinia dokdonensis TaxID=1409788 RepID=A0A0L8V8F4_9BACT|nr:hypothetical protein NC99_24650 [Sunxiuqinia dokdonensis]
MIINKSYLNALVKETTDVLKNMLWLQSHWLMSVIIVYI